MMKGYGCCRLSHGSLPLRHTCTRLYNPLCPSVGRLVRRSHFTFFMILLLWPPCSCPNGLVTSNMAPAHPHVTSVAVYPALFSSNAWYRLIPYDYTRWLRSLSLTCGVFLGGLITNLDFIYWIRGHFLISIWRVDVIPFPVGFFRPLTAADVIWCPLTNVQCCLMSFDRKQTVDWHELSPHHLFPLLLSFKTPFYRKQIFICQELSPNHLWS